MKELIIALISGVLFGLGLTISQMTNPNAVIGFLNILGNWSPRLIFVMVGALIITISGYFFILQKSKPVLAKEFFLPKANAIDSKLLIGASIFGVGWGLSGYCPGPAIAGLVINPKESVIFIGSMIAGIGLFKLLNRTA